MRLIILCAVCSLLTAAEAVAQNRSFPYQARVTVDELFVRSGGGDSWLPTQRLTRDTLVTVHRHDPGGWYMIEPPEGSFSWIPARFVKQLNDTEGEVIENNVVAFVGSEFGEDTTVWQRRLTTGEKITIINRKELVTLSGPQVMYQIKPPRREFRWVPGSGVIPVDESQRQLHDNDPYATPSNAVPKNAPSAAADGVTDVPAVKPGSELARLQQARADQVRLAAIDRQFRDMILRDPQQWNLDAIEADYKRLQNESTYKPIVGQIDLRFPAIERYRRKLADFQDFKRLTSQTERREAELLARVNPQYNRPPRHTTPTNVSSSGLVMGPILPSSTPELTRADSGFSPVSGAGNLPALVPPADDGTLFAFAPEPTVQGIAGSSEWEFVGQPPVSSVSSARPVASGNDMTFPEVEQFPQADSAVLLSPGAIDAGELAPFEFPVENASELGTEFTQGFSPDEAIDLTPSAESGFEAENPGTMTVDAAADQRAVPSRYVGAGVLQRSPSGSGNAPFVLTTPAGRVLAFVKPQTGLSLEAYLGHQVGVQGQRGFREELKSDVIEVSGLEVVRIRQ